MMWELKKKPKIHLGGGTIRIISLKTYNISLQGLCLHQMKFNHTSKQKKIFFTYRQGAKKKKKMKMWKPESQKKNWKMNVWNVSFTPEAITQNGRVNQHIWTIHETAEEKKINFHPWMLKKKMGMQIIGGVELSILTPTWPPSLAPWKW